MRVDDACVESDLLRRLTGVLNLVLGTQHWTGAELDQRNRPLASVGLEGDTDFSVIGLSMVKEVVATRSWIASWERKFSKKMGKAGGPTLPASLRNRPGGRQDRWPQAGIIWG